MAQGTIKKLIDRGFGFIDTGSGELFFHKSVVENSAFEELREGLVVEYEDGGGLDERPCAVNVKVVQPPSGGESTPSRPNDGPQRSSIDR